MWLQVSSGDWSQGSTCHTSVPAPNVLFSFHPQGSWHLEQQGDEKLPPGYWWRQGWGGEPQPSGWYRLVGAWSALSPLLATQASPSSPSPCHPGPQLFCQGCFSLVHSRHQSSASAFYPGSGRDTCHWGGLADTEVEALGFPGTQRVLGSVTEGPQAPLGLWCQPPSCPGTEGAPLPLPPAGLWTSSLQTGPAPSFALLFPPQGPSQSPPPALPSCHLPDTTNQPLGGL